MRESIIKIFFSTITFVICWDVADWLIGFDPKVKEDPDNGFAYLIPCLVVSLTLSTLVYVSVGKRLRKR